MKKNCWNKRKFVSVVLVFSMLTALFPMQVHAETLKLTEQVQQTAQYYQEIIMRDVPGCTWTEDTEVSHVTSLYDPYSELKGIVYEYQNGQTPVGFLQIDL